MTGATYNGVAMTLVVKFQSAGWRWMYLFYLAAPATGAHTLTVNWTGSTYCEINAASYTGVSQTGQPGANATNSNSGASTLTSTVTTVADNSWCVLLGGGQSGTIAAGAGTTRRATTLVGGILDSAAAITPAGSSSLTHTQLSGGVPIGGIIAAIAPVANDTLTLTKPVRYQLYQRSGTTGPIAIIGSVTGTTEDIEASFNGGAFVTIATAAAPGAFSGTLSGQAQGQGTLTVRKKTTTSTSAAVVDVGIGDMFPVGGDSVSEGRGTNVQSYAHATLKAVAFNQAGAWINGNDPVDTGTNIGSHWPLVATQIMASQGVPVGFITTGTGSSDVAGAANSWAKNNAQYAAMVASVAASGVNAVKGVLFHLGPNAVVNGSTLSLATYNAAIDQLAADINADLPGAPKINVGIFGEVNTGSPPDRRAALDNIRGAIIQAHGDNSNVKPGPGLIDQDYADDVHPKSDAELLAVAKRWWVALSETYYGGSGGRGPRLSSAQWNAGRNVMTVTFDRTLKTGLTFAAAAWIITDNGTAMTISSIAYHGTNAAALVFTMSASATGAGGTSRLTFASADDAKGLVVPLSADISMPSGAAIQIPAEPIYAATVSEVSTVITGPTGAAGAASISISRPDNQATAGTWTATNSVSWSLSGTNAALLAISAGGIVTKLTGNFNAGVQASYSFNVVNGASSQAVTMTITDATNPTWTGTISAGSITSSGAVITASASPADNVAVSVRQYRINGGAWANTDSAGASLSATLTGLSASSTYTPEMSALDAAGNRSTPTLVMPGAGTFTTLAPSGASVTVRLFTDVAQTIPAVNLTGLKVAFWQFATVDLITAVPFFKTAAGTTNSSGDLIISITGTSLLSGALGVLGVQDSTGNRFFLGSVPVA